MIDRRCLLDILDAGLRAADGRRCVREHLQRARPPGPLHLVAVGKASTAMTMGAVDALGVDIIDGVVVTRHGYGNATLETQPRFRIVESAHPVPDGSSIAAGESLMEYVQGLPRGAPVLALVSGGSSSLVDVPRSGIDATDLDRVNRWLIGSGLDIFAVNAVRRRLSRMKNGGLAAALWGHEVLALYLSDVQGDDPAWIGSGLLQSCDSDLPAGLPDWLLSLVTPARPASAPSGQVEHHVVGNLATALRACAEQAGRWSDVVTVHDEWLAGHAEQVAPRVIEELDRGRPGVYIWGGETTVRLPQRPGRGGRNQHLALSCAVQIEGRADLAVLCAATDGVDGPGEDAGALVDGGTLLRGRDGGFEAMDSLAAADAGSFLEASGDLVFTGPTSTNVNDILVGLKAKSG